MHTYTSSSLPPSLLPPHYPQVATPAGLGRQVSKRLQEEWDKEIPPASLTRLLKVNSPEWWLIVVGVLGAVVNGSIFPIYSILFGEVLRVFQESLPGEIVEEITTWALLFLMLAVVSAIAIFFKVSWVSFASPAKISPIPTPLP